MKEKSLPAVRGAQRVVHLPPLDRIGSLARAIHLGFDLLRELGDLREPVDRLVEVAAAVRIRLERVDTDAKALEELLRALERGVRSGHLGHAVSRMTRLRIPLTSRAASSVA